jgi:hypothetical protein
VNRPVGLMLGKLRARLTETMSLFLKEEGETIALTNDPVVFIVKVMTPCEIYTDQPWL